MPPLVEWQKCRELNGIPGRDSNCTRRPYRAGAALRKGVTFRAEERRELVLQRESHSRAARTRQARGAIHLHGARCLDARCHRVATCVAPRRVSVTTSRDTSSPSLIPTPAKPIPSPRDFVLAATSWYRARSLRRIPRPSSGHGERAFGRVREHVDPDRSRVESVRHDFRENRLLDLAAVSVPEILEEVLQVYAGFSHDTILSFHAGMVEVLTPAGHIKPCASFATRARSSGPNHGGSPAAAFAAM